MHHVIETDGLTKTYPNGFTAVSNLTMKVPRGVFGFLGPNAAGKTTTIEILVGAMRPTSGTARILGHDIIEDSIEVRKLIGYLPENPGFYDGMSGLRFLRYMGELGGLSGPEASEMARELLKWIGLGEWGESAIARYSAGMRQRLALAQALVCDPEVIFLDEPAANLDPAGRADIIKRVRGLAKQGKSVFVSTHILSEIEQMADHVAIISDGKLVVQGSIEKLIRGQETKGYEINVSEPELLQKELETQDFVTEVRMKHGQILVKTKDHEKLWTIIPKLVSKHNMQLRALEPIRLDLQTIYRDALEKARRAVR